MLSNAAGGGDRGGGEGRGGVCRETVEIFGTFRKVGKIVQRSSIYLSPIFSVVNVLVCLHITLYFWLCHMKLYFCSSKLV